MSRTTPIVILARRIRQAVAAADWSELQRADAEVAAALPVLAARGPWEPEERAALAVLRQAHDEARTQCDEATRQLEKRLAELREGKDGWLAYAQDGGAEIKESIA